MRTTILTAALTLLMGASYASAECAMKMEGTDLKVENREDGVTITLTSKDKAVVKKIQEQTKANGGCACRAKMKGAKADKAAKGAYTCPMKGCYTGPATKDGKCPHCGMKLEEKKG